MKLQMNGDQAYVDGTPVPTYIHEDATKHIAVFQNAKGQPIEVHLQWEVEIEWSREGLFDGPECPRCPMFMYCTTHTGKHTLDPIKAPVCGECQATGEITEQSDDTYGLLLFITGKCADRPFYFRLSKAAYESVQALDLLNRFDRCVGAARVSNKCTALLFQPKTQEQENIPFFIFAILHFIEGKLAERNTGADNDSVSTQGSPGNP